MPIVYGLLIYRCSRLYILHCIKDKFRMFTKSSHTNDLPLPQTFTVHTWVKQDIWIFYSVGLALFA